MLLKKKHVMALLVTLLMVLTIVPVAVGAVDFVCDAGTVTVTCNATSSDASSVTVTAAKGVTETITIKHNSNNLVFLSFDYNVSGKNGGFTIGGSSASDSGTYKGIVLSGQEIVLTVAGKSGFLGFGGGDATLKLSNVTLTEAKDGVAYFLGDNGVVYEGLTEALSSGSTQITLLNDATIAAGNYTIPASMTLLIPFDDAHTVYEDKPEAVEQTYVKPSAYRTLRLEKDAHIVVNGKLSIPAKHTAPNGGSKNAGSPTEKYGHISMEEGSSITVNSGAALYAYGYITGKGTVTAKSGASIWEYFQMMDFRGGSATTDIAQTNKSKGVFPLNQYYVQNIEVPMTLEAGATERGYSSVCMNVVGALGTDIGFIGTKDTTDAMFKLTSGTITKYYDGSKDRLIIEVNGNVEVAPISVRLSTVSIDSSEFVLPINGNLTIKVLGGNINIEQDIALFPGTEMIIGKEAICTLGQGHSVYVYDSEQWGLFCGAGNKAKFLPLDYAPGRTYNRTEADLVDASVVLSGKINASAGYLYTTESGANITGEEDAVLLMQPNTATSTNQYEYNAGFIPITITSAKLTNNDGSFTETNDITNSIAYIYKDGKWGPCQHENGYTSPKIDPTCEKEGFTGAIDCPVCGYKQVDESIPANKHNTVGEIIIEKADCHIPGSKRLTCSNENCDWLNNTSVVEIPAAHNLVEYPRVEPVECKTDGNVAYWHCVGSCGLNYNISTPSSDEEEAKQFVLTDEQIVLPAHSMVPIVATASTCTQHGNEAGEKCSRNCGYQIGGEELPLAGHKMTPKPGVEPTCGHSGSSPYYLCETCDLFYEDEAGTTPIDNLLSWQAEGGRGYLSNKDIAHTPEVVKGHEATCAAPGLTDGSVCSVCDAVLTDQEEIPTTNHKLNEGSETISPTCSTEGEMTYQCVWCTYTEKTTIAKETHTEKILPAVPASCTKTGLTEGKQCTVCNEITVKQEVVEKLAHVETTIPAVDATCTAPGLTEGKRCTKCGEFTVEQTEIPATGHTPVVDKAEAPTCIATGLTEGSHCYTCGETIVAQETVDALGHQIEKVPGKAATCTEAGLTDGEKCTVCDYVVHGEPISATGHKNETVPGKAATCTETGLTDGEKCSVCGITTKEQSIIATLPHNKETIIPAVPATCIATGSTEGSKCSVCGTVQVEPQPTEMLPHSYSSEVTTQPTCTEKGITTYTCTTPRCGNTYTKDDVAATGHKEESIPAIAATCTEDGKTEGTKCSACGEILVAQQTVPALGHIWNEGVIDPAATCTVDGTKTFTCSVCKETETEPVKATGHSYTSAVTKAPTCTATGTETFTCSVCQDRYEKELAMVDHSFVNDGGTPATCTKPGETAHRECSVCHLVEKNDDGTSVSIPALGHTYDDGQVKTAATCAAPGEMIYTCTREGCTEAEDQHTKTESIAQLTHVYDEGVITGQTCTENGVKTYTCQQPGCPEDFEGHTKTETVLALGHNELTILPYRAATCTETGLKEGTACSRCGKIQKAQETIPAQGHNFVEDETQRVAATCSKEGTKFFKCTRTGCEETKTETIPMLAHTPVVVSGKAATCTENGLTDGTACSVCGTTIKKQEIIDKTGHTPRVLAAVAATCSNTGLTEGSDCSVCGEILVEQKVVGKTSHIPVVTHGYAATCQNPGLTDGSYCSVCGGTIIKQEVIAQEDHTPKVIPGIPSTCTKEGLSEGSECEKCHTILKAQSELPLADHVPTPVEGYDSSCKITGLTDGSKCSVCNTVIVAQEIIPLKPHTIEILPSRESTCTEHGLTAGEKCSFCDEILTKQEESPLKDHTRELEAGSAATCEAIGWTDGERCSVCKAVLTAREVIPALGHEEIVLPGKAATCTSNGLTEGKMCAREGCGRIVVPQVKIDLLNHSMTKVEESPATCSANGTLEHYLCSVCNKTFADADGKTEIIDPNALLIKKLPHTEEIDAAVPATCEEAGLTEGKHCSVCEMVILAQQVVPAAGHREVILPAVTGTCEVDGETEGKKCSVCDKILVEKIITPAPGHDMSEATCELPATCQREGCGYTDGEKLGHIQVQMEEVPAQCLEPGYKAGVWCSRCEKAIMGMEKLPALGHDLVQHPAKAPTYSNVGWEAYEDCSRCSYTTIVEIPALDPVSIEDYDSFMENLEILEDIAADYIKTHPGKDPAALVIKYIRTGVDRYNSGSWNIMAGYQDEGFAEFVAEYEDNYNSTVASVDEMITVTALKDIENFELPNGELADIGHVFGTMDITYHNKFSQNHGDVAGWAGDIVDLVSAADQYGAKATELEALIAELKADFFLKGSDYFTDKYGEKPIEGSFSYTDFLGDLDGFYIMDTLQATDYSNGTLTRIFSNYFTEDLDEVTRADYFIENRLDGTTLRAALRDAVYNEYVANRVVSTLESTREFKTDDLTLLRKACCYVFADYICQLAGDYVEVTDNKYFTVFNSESSVLAPGITQDFKQATTADNKQVTFYLATADLSREDVHIYANYNNNDPNQGWAMQRVLDQANAAQEKYGDPASDQYIENYNVIASINGGGYNMSTGEPGGVLVMNGVEYHRVDGSGFFGILKDGTPYIGSTEEYYRMKDQVMEAIAGFGVTLIRDGQVAIDRTDSYYVDRASRTAVGITGTGKVVFLVVDGRQEPWSCGSSMQEIAQMMFEAGCVQAINLDGGGSTTYVAKEEGEDQLAVVSRPSDGYARSVSTTLMMVSTAPSSTAFHHAVIESDYNYMTVDSEVKLTAFGVSATGNSAPLPEGTNWVVDNESIASVDENGVLTAKALGDVEVLLMLGEDVLARKTISVVIPENLYFTATNINMVYGATVDLPIKAVYENKEVAVNDGDFQFTLDNPAGGFVMGRKFTAVEESPIKILKITGQLTDVNGTRATVTVSLFKQGEAVFDFDKATGGDRQLAWDRTVSNSVTTDKVTYYVVKPEEEMITTYTYAIDMSKIEVPEQLADLTYMLPGYDAADASAWTFLCQLAERVNDLTEVKPVITFAPDVTVDVSEITLKNEYFALTNTELDEATNTLTLTLNWIDQTHAIEPSSANPICIVSGIKLTPKADAVWTKDQLEIVTSGNISYKVYLRANALYSFCQKPENQAAFGLKPYVDPRNSKDSGGYFEANYKTFEDTYRLNRAQKSGWTVEDGGFAYYGENGRYTGIQVIDGFYYDFGENGINIGQTKYTGWMEDENGKQYARVGVLQNGWQQIGTEMYHIHEDGYVHEVTVTDYITCIRGGRRTYTCKTCNQKETAKSYTMPQGHTWDENHVCTVCGFKGIDISDTKVVTIGFGTLDEPVTSSMPRYIFKASGVRPIVYATSDGKTEMTMSSDATLNDDGTMRDLFMARIDNNKVGYSSIKFTGKGNYYGERTLTFKIIPGNATNLRAEKTTKTTVTLAWDAAPGAETYRVYSCDVNGNNAKLIATVTKTSYKVEGLEAASTTYYKVACSATAHNADEVINNSKWSNVLTVKTRLTDVGDSYVLGDVNGDEKVDNDDYGYVLRYMFNYRDNVAIEHADVDRNGVVDNDDYGYILRYMFDYDDNLGIGEPMRK